MLATLEVILLALPTAIRPTSLAAIYAMLSRDAPRRLMIAYTVVGLAFTIAIGLLVVWAFNGVQVDAGSSELGAILTIVGGGLMLALAVGIVTGRVPWPPASGHAGAGLARTDALLDRAVTVRMAALAGPATHLPGLFYLVALNLIVADNPPAPQPILDVLAYNAVWFVLPIGAMAVCIVRPATARQGVAALERWITEHARSIAIVVSLTVGAALVVRGLLSL
ncbi:MAG: GAP family protein [Solirubrobacteraceae bacterium]